FLLLLISSISSVCVRRLKAIKARIRSPSSSYSSLDRYFQALTLIIFSIAFTLTLVLCRCSDISLNDLITVINKHHLSESFSPRELSIPKHPPVTRAQFEEWRKLWP